MILTVLAEKNHYTIVIQSEEEALVLEAGVSPEKLYDCLGFNLKKISGCLITHSHIEQSNYAKEYTQDMNVYSSGNTLKYLNISHCSRVKSLKGNNHYQVGKFIIFPFELKHDVHCFGYFINHAETGRIVYATDSVAIPYKFNEMDHIFIGCYYDAVKLNKRVKNGVTPVFIQKRIIETQLEFNTVKGFLKLNDISKVKNILLCHLSNGNSDPERFKEEIMLETKINTEIAIDGLTIDLKA